MDLPICEHVKIGGERCGSPALHDQKFCYYHAAVHRLVPRMNILVRINGLLSDQLPNAKHDFPYLEDAAALQIGFSQLIHAVSQETIDHRMGRLILSALQSAAANLRYAEWLTKNLEKADVTKKEPCSVGNAGAKPRRPQAVSSRR